MTSLMLSLFLTTASVAEEPLHPPGESIRIAQRLLENGEIGEAEALLLALRSRHDASGRIARFGLANAKVLRAAREKTDSQEAPVFLMQAIREYRLLASEPGDLPVQDDIRHNILVAKLYLADALAGKKKHESMTPHNEEAAEQKEGAPQPSAESDVGIASSEEADGAPKSIRAEHVLRASGPLEDTDPGTLSIRQADTLIKTAVERSNDASHRSSHTPHPRRAPSDR